MIPIYFSFCQSNNNYNYNRYLCLKEKNMLLSDKLQRGMVTGKKPSDVHMGRLVKVKKTMARIKTVSALLCKGN